MEILKEIKSLINRSYIEKSKTDNNFYIIQVGCYTTSGEGKKQAIKNIIKCLFLNIQHIIFLIKINNKKEVLKSE